VIGQPGDSTPASSPVLSYFAWWDCPRGGIVTIDGRVHYFASEFSEVLDDYAPTFRLWPVPDEALEPELESWAAWVAWRSSFDRGEHPAPYDQEDRLRALSSFRRPPEDSLLAMPEWEMDPDRSYAVRPPNHRVRWTILTANA